jgi:hypothetical protein|nr:MAG TPA_asm: hypothetical protein [Bacteriophage sp.]
MLIYDGVKPIRPEYRVVTDDAIYFVEANRCEIAQDDGIIIFNNKDSVQAMFRLDDVKALWRIL